MMLLLPTAVDAVLAVLLPLADDVPEASEVTPGIYYFLAFAALVGAVVLLWFSLRKHLNKIRFDEQPAPDEGGDDRPPTR